MTPEDVAAVVADRPGFAWLDGGNTGPWSILAWDPVDVVTDGADWPETGRRLQRAGGIDPKVPFAGGCLGYLGFGAGHRVERVPPQDPTPEPEVWLGAYDGALCYRHCDGAWLPAGSDRFVRAAREVLDAARPLGPPPPPPTPRSRTMDRDAFEARVRRVLDWLAEGDCYQVNLTRAVHLDGIDGAWPAYRRLRAASAAEFGAFLRLGDATVLSNSPELFLRVRGREAVSEPIKGTRPRVPGRDDELVRELLASPKDRAELTMIVDLVRNDLGRVAIPGSVRADDRVVTSHANVHHASWRVGALLRDGIDAWAALTATFPPGSVTGAPKIRACERIAMLEPEPRGVYCGAIGHVAASGDATWSVAIRTAVAVGSTARYHVGGGIVAASDPAEEWLETVDKGRVLAMAFGL